MLWRSRFAADDIKHKPHWIQGILAGFGVGVLTGFLGVGGGFLIVPALVFFGGLPVKRAIGTSLFVIFLNCVAGILGHLSSDVFDLGLTGIVMGLAVAGAAAGSLLSQRIAAHRLQKIFAVLVLGIGALMIAKNSAVIF
jgi:hypothetical protein